VRRYSSFYGLDSELSAASVASQAANNSSKAAARKVRTRVSGGYKPGLMASAAAAAEADAAAHAGASVGSSLAASTSFVPFMHLGMQQLGLAQQRGEADDVQGRPGKGLSPRRHQQQDTGAAGAAAGSGAAVGRPAWHKHADGSSLGRQCKQGSGSPNAARGQHSPSRAKQHAGADRGWARRATLPQRRQTKRC
jgi:hypothetical protein